MDRKIIVAGHISYDITPQIYDTNGKNFAKLLKPGKLIKCGQGDSGKWRSCKQYRYGIA